MKNLLLVIFLSACSTGCPHNPGPRPGPLPCPDGGAKATCADACARLKQLGCKGSGPTPEGADCVEICGNLVDSNVIVDLECRARAASCEAIDRCEIAQ